VAQHATGSWVGDNAAMSSAGRPLDRLTAEDFRPLLAKRVSVLDERDALLVQAELVEVNALGTGAPDAPREPFSLVFRGPAAPALAQRIYRLVVDELGELDLFLVPIGLDGTGMRYEAVFG
jgi:hypothetical protein